MKVFCISNDSFLSQELIMGLAPNEHKVEVYTHSLNALKDIRDEKPDVVIIDNDCDGVNPLVLIKLIKRDSNLEDIVVHLIEDRERESVNLFADGNGISKIWVKPVNYSELINLLLRQ